MNCWIASAKTKLNKGKGPVLQQYTCENFMPCIDLFCNIYDSKKTEVGEVSTVNTERFDSLFKWLKANCGHPQKKALLDHVCNCFDAGFQVLIPKELEDSIAKMFSASYRNKRMEKQ